MEFIAALRGLRSRKGAFAVQVGALSVGLTAALMCLQLYGIVKGGVDIPGAKCGSSMRRVALISAGGEGSLRFTEQQARLLREASDGVFRAMPLSLEVDGERGPVMRGVTALDTDFFSAFCITTSAGRWPESNAQEVAIPEASASRRDVRIGVGVYEVVGRYSDYRGLSRNNPSSLYIPIAQLRSSGFNLSDAKMASLLVIADASSGENVLRDSLETVVQRHPSVFGPSSKVELQRISDLSPDDVRKIRRLASITAIVSGAFLFLGMLTVLSYQFGRIAAMTSMVELFRELGAPRRAMLTYAVTEPLLAFTIAIALSFCAGGIASPLVQRWLGATVEMNLNYWLSVAVGIVLAALVASLVVASTVVALARQGFGRELKRSIQKTFGYVLGAQFFAGCLVVLPAIAAALAFWCSIPKARGYDIDNIRVHTIFLPVDKIPDSFPGRLQSFLAEIESRVQGKAALSWSTYPVPGISGQTSQVRYNGRAATIEVNSVTSSYFDVLGLVPVRGRSFTAAELPASKSGLPIVAVANTQAQDLLDIHQIPSSPLTIGKESSFIRGEVSVIGVVDERTSGNDSPRSAVRLGPAVYIPWRPQGPFLVLVRHQGMNERELDAVIETALDRYVPEWRTAEIQNRPTSLESLYRQATAQQRTTFFMFGSLAGGALVLALLGLLGTAVMVLNLNRLSYAIREHLGATRVGLLKHHLLLIATPLVIGLALSAAVCAFAAGPVAELMVLPQGSAASLWLGTLACIVSFSVFGLFVSGRALFQAKLSDTWRSKE